MNLASSIEEDPIWKKRKRINYIDAIIYRKYYGSTPLTLTVTIDIYEMDDECDMLFHNFLMRKESLDNTLIRSPE
jgi:hypothetical protein